jgi:hypothetical protein
MTEEDLTQEDLHNWFRYEPETGKMYWKESFAHRVKVGDEAGAFCTNYIRVGIFGAKFQMHRLIWLMLKGPIPPGYLIDHKNGDGTDNRLDNLRLATYTQNNQNAKSLVGSSKYKGVHWFKRDSCWQAKIEYDGKTHHLGYFVEELEAAEAYKKEALKIHGEFFNNGVISC